MSCSNKAPGHRHGGANRLLVRWAAVVLVIALSLILSACGRQPAAVSSPVVPTQQPAPASPPQPSPTTLPPAPTATMAMPEAASPSPSPTSQTSPTSCQYGYFFEPAPGNCPAGPATTSAAAEQPFEGGVLIWLEETGSILVLFDDGRWQRFEDTWSEGQPENDPSFTPPEGRFQPIRGFGTLWREQPGIREALGWALGVELGFESTYQEQAPLPDQPPITYLRTYNGQIYGLIGREPDLGDWVVAADNR